MRINIAKEGEVWPDGKRMLAHGAMQWDPDQRIPVFDSFNRRYVVGHVTDIRREDDGSITGELTLRIDDKHTSYGVYQTQVNENDPNIIEHGVLREISMDIPIPYSIKENDK